MKKLIIIILISLLFISCKTKKTQSTTIIKDSIREKVQLNIVKSGFNLTRLYNPCDEFGNLRPIFYNSSSGGLETTIKDDNGTILINQNQKQDTIFKEKLVYRDKLIYKDKLVEVEVKRPFNFYSILLNVIFALWIFRNPLIKLIKPI